MEYTYDPAGNLLSVSLSDPDDDGDTFANSQDQFPDDRTEWADFDQDGTGDNADTDDDNDEMSDVYESQNGLNPNDASDRTADPDNDGFANFREAQAGTNPRDASDTPQPGSFSFASVGYEATEGADTAVVLTVSRLQGSDGDVSVFFASSDHPPRNGVQSANAGQDYTAVSGRLDFAHDETSKTIEVRLLDDSQREGSERLHVSLDNPTDQAVLGDFLATVIIRDDEPAPLHGEFNTRQASVLVSEDAGFVSIPHGRNNGTDGDVCVEFFTEAGTASAGVDFTATQGQSNVAQGDSEAADIQVPILDNDDYQGDRQFEVKLRNPCNGSSLGPMQSTTVTIVEDDPTPPAGTLQFDVAEYSVDEASGQAELSIVRLNGDFGSISASLRINGPRTTDAQDHDDPPAEVVFATGETEQIITVSVNDDAVFEGNESFVLELHQPSENAGLGEPVEATITIVENDPAPRPGGIRLSGSSVVVDESGSSVVLVIQRINGSDGLVSVDYATVTGSADADVDYQEVSGTTAFADGDMAPKEIVVPILDDAEIESDETFRFVLSNPQGEVMLVADTEATVTITDDEPRPNDNRADAGVVDNPPQDSTAEPLADNVVLNALRLEVHAEAVQAFLLQSLTVQASGSGDDVMDISRVRLFEDANRNGVVDDGETLLATIIPTQDNGRLELTLTSPIEIQPGTAIDVLVTASFN